MIKEEKWNLLERLDQLEQLEKDSFKEPVIIFKHSIRCSISAVVWDKFNRNMLDVAQAQFWYLDIINHRDISNKIAEKYNVIHQSPQVIVISAGRSIFDTSHNGISYQKVNELIQSY